MNPVIFHINLQVILQPELLFVTKFLCPIVLFCRTFKTKGLSRLPPRVNSRSRGGSHNRQSQKILVLRLPTVHFATGS